MLKIIESFFKSFRFLKKFEKKMFLIVRNKKDNSTFKISSDKYDILKILPMMIKNNKYNIFIFDEPSVNIIKKEVIAYSMDDLIKEKNIFERTMEYFDDPRSGKETRYQKVDQVKFKYDTIIGEDYNNFVKAVSKNIETLNYDKVAEMFQNIGKEMKYQPNGFPEIPLLINKLDNADYILSQQQNWIEKLYNYQNYLQRGGNKNNYDRMWFVRSYLNDQYYGGVFLFQSRKEPTVFYMEGISKSQAVILFELMYPKIKLPSLNELLIPFIENLIVKNGGKILYVVPMKAQYKILTEKYNFMKSEDEPRKYISQIFTILDPTYGRYVSKSF
jgi:hypothetical protein